MVERTETTTIDTATPTEATGDAAPAADAPTRVSMPGAGARTVIATELGASYQVDAQSPRFSQDGGDLVVSTDDGTVVFQDYFVLADTGLPPALSLADGTVIGGEDLLAALETFDAEAVASAAGAPAAGPGDGGTGGGGAGFRSYVSGSPLGESIDTLDLLGDVDLAFEDAAVQEERATDLAEGSLSVRFVSAETEVGIPEQLPGDFNAPNDGGAPPTWVTGAQSGIFEDSMPNQDEGWYGKAYGQLVIDLTPADNETFAPGSDLTITPDADAFDGWSMWIGEPGATGSVEVTPTDGAYAVPVEQIENIFLVPPEHADGDVPFAVTATIVDPDSGVTADISGTGTAVLDAVADKATFTDDALNGDTAGADYDTGDPQVGLTFNEDQASVTVPAQPFGLDLDSSAFTDGAAIHTTLDLTTGQTVSIPWSFDGTDYIPFNDAAFVVVNGQPYKLSDIRETGDYGDESGTFTLTATGDGAVTIGFVVLNDGDTLNDPSLTVGDISIDGVPQNATFATIGAVSAGTGGGHTLTANGATPEAVAADLGIRIWAEDTSVYNIGFQTQTPDQDGSESISRIVLNFSDLTNGIAAEPPSDRETASILTYNGSDLYDGAEISLIATVVDPQTGARSQMDVPARVQINGTQVTLTVLDPDTGAPLVDHSTDPGVRSDSELRVVEVNLADGTNGSGLQIDLPQHLDDDFAYKATVTTNDFPTDTELADGGSAGNNQAESQADFSVDIKAVADAPTIDAVADAEVDEDATAATLPGGAPGQRIGLPPINVAFPDQDGSEEHRVELGFTFAAGAVVDTKAPELPDGPFYLQYPDGQGGVVQIEVGAGAIDVPLDQLGNLSVVGPEGWYGDINVTVTGTATEVNVDNGVESDSDGSSDADDIARETASSDTSFTITVDATPDEYAPDGGQDTGPVSLTIGEPAVNGGDGSGGDDDGTAYTGGAPAPSVTGALNIEFGDDYPATIEVNLAALNAELANLTSENRTLTAVSDGNGGAIVKADDGETVLTIAFGGTAPNYTYTVTLNDNLDHPFGTDEPINLPVGITATDSDGDSITSGFQVTITDDGPRAEDDTSALVEGQSTTGDVFANDEGGADGATVTTATGTGPTSIDANTGAITVQGQYGTLTLNPDGTYTYVANGNLDNAQPVTDSFTYEVIDGDGDAVTAQLDISVSDGAEPTVESGSISLAVQENEITDSASEAVTFSAGSDNLSVAFADPAEVGNGITVTGLQGGAALNWALVGGQLVGYTTDQATPELTLSLSGDTAIGAGTAGSVTVTATLSDALKHAGDTLSISGVKVVATDTDGDSTVVDVAVSVADDAPEATLMADGATTIAEDAAGALTGTWTAPLGADGAGDVTFTVAGQSQTLGSDPLTFTVADAGTLTVNPNGTWAFDPDPDGDNAAGVSVDIAVAATDGDGDTASASLTLTVTDGDGPSTDAPAADPLALGLDEAGLAAGAESASGTLAFTAGSDAIAAIAFGDPAGITVSGLDDQASLAWNTDPATGNLVGSLGGQPVITLALGGATAVAAGTTGSVTVTATLDAAWAHENDVNADELILSGIEVVATDTDGDTSTAHVSVSVADDAPEANDDVAGYIEEGSDNPASLSGNVITGAILSGENGTLAADDTGADGAQVHSFTVGQTTYTFDADGTLVDDSGAAVTQPVATEYGLLTLSPDGTYTYTPNGSVDHTAEKSIGNSGTGGMEDAWASDTVSVNAFDFMAFDGATFDPTSAVYDGTVTYDHNGLGVAAAGHGSGGAPGQINHGPGDGSTQGLVVNLGEEASAATVKVSNLFETESTGETGHWWAYDADGTLVGEAAFTLADGQNVGEIDISAAAGFQYLVFTAEGYADGGSVPGDSSDYYVRSISYTVRGSAEESISYTLIDGDGDVSNAANLTFSVKDGEGPTVSSGAVSLSMQENEITDSASEAVTFHAGSDNLSVAFADPAEVGNDITVTGLQGGAALNWALVGGQLVGYTTDQATPELTLSLSGDTAIGAGTAGSVTVTATLSDALKHAGDSISISGVKLVGTDTDGDRTVVDVALSVTDDAPTAGIAADGATAIAEDAAGALTGTWTAPLGADGAGDVTFTVAGQSQTLGSDPLTFTVANAGTLTVNPDGTWAFDPDPNGDNAAGVSVDIAVAATDGDGDTASASLTLTVTDGDGPSTSAPADDPLALGLDEAALAAGAESASGTLAFTAGSDAITSIAFGDPAGITVSGLDDQASLTWSTDPATGNLTGSLGGQPVITLALGGAATVAAGTTGSVTVTATLDAAWAHENDVNADELILSGIEVVATDTDGDTSTAHVTVSIADDAPEAVGTGPDQTVLDDAAPVTVNLAGLFDGGTDGIVEYRVNGTPVSGSTYTFDPSSVGLGTYGFTVTAVDADGDTATNDFSFTVEASNQPPETNGLSANGVQAGADIVVPLSGADDHGIDHYEITDFGTAGDHGTFYYDDGAGPVAITVGTEIPASATVYYNPDDTYDGTLTFAYRAVDSDDMADPTPATGTIEVADAGPTATDNIVSVTEITETVNVALMIDTSGSMNETVGGSGSQSRLDMTKAAIHDLLDSYGSSLGKVMLVEFWSDAEIYKDGSGAVWMSAQDALNHLDSFVAGGNTDYDAAISEVMNNYGAPPPADKTVGYFLSDGEPWGFDWFNSNAINASERAAWETFLNGKFDEVYAVGVGSDLANDSDVNDHLGSVAWSSSGDNTANILIVADEPDLSGVLSSTVTTYSGNVITDDDSDGVDASGADGWASGNVLTSVEFEGTTYTPDGNGKISIDLTEGMIVFDAATGAYTFTQDPDVNLSGDVTHTFKYTVADGDGSTASADLILTLVDSQGPSSDAPLSDPLSLTLDEDALIGGTESDNGAITFTAGTKDITSIAFADPAAMTITIPGLDDQVSVSWSLDSAGNLVGAIGTTQVITLTLNGPTAITAGTSGAVTVTATLDEAWAHQNNVNVDDFTIEGIEVVATDAEGASTSGHVGITVLDDTPEFTDVENGILANSGGDNSLDGALAFTGADDPITVELSVDADWLTANGMTGQSWDPATNTLTVSNDDGPAFTVTANNDGTYTFDLVQSLVSGTTAVNGHFDATTKNAGSPNEPLGFTLTAADGTPFGITFYADHTNAANTDDLVLNSNNQGVGTGSGNVNQGDRVYMHLGQAVRAATVTLDKFSKQGPKVDAAAWSAIAFTVDGLTDTQRHWLLDNSEIVDDGSGNMVLKLTDSQSGVGTLGDVVGKVVASGSVSATGNGESARQAFDIASTEDFDLIAIEPTNGDLRVLGLKASIESGHDAVTEVPVTATATDSDGDTTTAEFRVTVSDDQELVGTAADEVLVGGAGDDTIDGGAGSDVLVGGGGADTFVVGDGDIIADFTEGEDTINLDALFDALDPGWDRTDPNAFHADVQDAGNGRSTVTISTDAGQEAAFTVDTGGGMTAAEVEALIRANSNVDDQG